MYNLYLNITIKDLHIEYKLENVTDKNLFRDISKNTWLFKDIRI